MDANRAADANQAQLGAQDANKATMEENHSGLVAEKSLELPNLGSSFDSSAVGSIGKRHFARLIGELVVEHERQVGRLLGLIRDLRLELDRATGTKGESTNLSELSLTGFEFERQLVAERETTLGSQNTPRRQHFSAEREATHGSQGTPRTPRNMGALGSINVAAHVQQEACALQGMQQVSTPPLSQPSNSKDFTILEGSVPESPRIQGDGLDLFEDVPQEKKPSARTLPSVRRLSSRISSLPPSHSMGDENNLSRLERIVTSTQFEIFSGLLIVANAVVMMVEMQYLGLEAGFVTGYPGIGSRNWPGATRAFEILEQFWIIVFAAELLIRFAGIKWRLFCNPLNWIDIIAVVVGMLQWAVDQMPLNPVIIRLFRLVKLVRGIRFVKLTRVLHSLNLLIKCIQASVSTLFWSLCLLMMIQCIIGMVACQLAQDYILDTSNPEDLRHELYTYYGTFSRSFVTMFELHMANWAKPCRVFMATLGELYGDIFVFYRCILGFSLMNVIGAVFVQQTMSVAQQDNDIMIVQKQRAAQLYKVKLLALFKALDNDGDGNLSREEFEAMGKDPALQAWMSALDINVHDLEGLFDLLDSGDGMISVEEFMTGAQRLQGAAKNIDMAHLMVTTSKLDRNVERLMGMSLAEDVVSMLEPRLAQLERNTKANEDRSWWAGRRQQSQRLHHQLLSTGPSAANGSSGASAGIGSIMQSIADMSPSHKSSSYV